MSGDPQHRTSLLSPLPCPLLLSTSRLTVVTPSLYRPCPSIVTLSSHRLSITIPSLSRCLFVTVFSSSHRPPVVPSPLFHHFTPPFCLPYYSLLFMVPLLFINPDISVPLLIYPPFPSRDPHLFLLGSPAR